MAGSLATYVHLEAFELLDVPRLADGESAIRIAFRLVQLTATISEYRQ